MGGFLNIGGSSSKTDRKTALTGWSNLNNIFNTFMPFAQQTAQTGTTTTGQGIADLQASKLPLNQSTAYWSSLLSGNRSTLEQAVAPEAGAVRSSADAAARQAAAMGTARGGGVNAASQQREDETRARIDQYIFGVRPTAASQLAANAGEAAKIGAAEGALGTSILSEALGFGELGYSAEATMAGQASSARASDFAINQQIVGNATTGIMNILGKLFPGAAG
jgi:hypothetical protein